MMNLFSFLLPSGRAWRTVYDGSLRKFFSGLSLWGDDVKTFYDNIYDDINPSTTRCLDEYENMFGEYPDQLGESDRRTRLDGIWKALGGQSPRYIQDTLQNAGFDLYVHDWYPVRPAPGFAGCTSPRNPNSVISSTEVAPAYSKTCGDLDATCGDTDTTCGSRASSLGYLLVNIVPTVENNWTVTCNSTGATCGNNSATCGSTTGSGFGQVEYTIPTTSDKWKYFCYIGAETYGELALIPEERREELERLVLKIVPEHLWIGMLVQYS